MIDEYCIAFILFFESTILYFLEGIRYARAADSSSDACSFNMLDERCEDIIISR